MGNIPVPEPTPKTDATPEVTAGRSHDGRGTGGTAHHRRDQIVDAAIEIIGTQGIHKLSLGNIEKRVKMTRGHLTYYFKTKDAILMAVLDRMLQRMIAEKLSGDGPKPMTGRARECFEHALADCMRPPGPESLAFLSLIHTFHAQMSYRPDVRQKIAELNAQWRRDIAADYAASVPNPPVAPTVAASLVMALMIGLSAQTEVDPNAFDQAQMSAAIVPLLAPLFRPEVPAHA